jgi:hypothetical protein
MNKIFTWLEEIREVEVEIDMEKFNHEWINLQMDEDECSEKCDEIFMEKKFGKFFKISKVINSQE